MPGLQYTGTVSGKRSLKETADGAFASFLHIVTHDLCRMLCSGAEQWKAACTDAPDGVEQLGFLWADDYARSVQSECRLV
jgi:hypothetical protein